MSTLAVEHRIDTDAEKARKRLRARIVADEARASVRTALDGRCADIAPDIARAHIDAWADFLAGVEGPVHAATCLAAKAGRLAPLRPRSAVRLEAETLFRRPV